MAALQESSLFLALAEYDAAQNALDAAGSRRSWLTDVRARAQLLKADERRAHLSTRPVRRSLAAMARCA